MNKGDNEDTEEREDEGCLEKPTEGFPLEWNHPYIEYIIYILAT